MSQVKASVLKPQPKSLLRLKKNSLAEKHFLKVIKTSKKRYISVTGRTGHQAGGSGGVTTIVLKGSLPQLRETKLKNNSWQWRMDRTEVKQRGRENKFPLNGQYFGRFLQKQPTEYNSSSNSEFFGDRHDGEGFAVRAVFVVGECGTGPKRPSRGQSTEASSATDLGMMAAKERTTLMRYRIDVHNAVTLSVTIRSTIIQTWAG